MTLSSLLLQLLNGLAGASSLFLVAAGLSLIFGVTRIVNFAHGSLTMLGLYVAISVSEWLGTSSGWGFWGSILLAALGTALMGVLIEILLLRRIYHVPELFQLLATFALVLVIKDLALYVWGAEELLGPRAPGFTGAVELFGQAFPKYNLLMMVIGPVVLLLLWLLLTRTRWGTLVRAATQDRDMVSALGVNQAWLFTSVFGLGAFLAGLGGAIQMPNEPASLHLDLQTIGDAFVVVVVGGMGSLPGAYVAALLIALTKAMCAALGTVHAFGLAISFSKLTLVVEFLIMAIVLVVRPWGLLGKVQAAARGASVIETPLRPASGLLKNLGVLLVLLLLLLPLLNNSFPYLLVLGIDLLIAALFAASLHFIMGPGGMHSFGHAAYFGSGCLWGCTHLQAAGGSHGDGPGAGTTGCGSGRVYFWLVLRAPVRRVSGHADACLWSDCLVDHVSVGRGHWWFQRRGGRVAGGLARAQMGLLLPDACAHRGGRSAAASHVVLALWVRDARRARFASAG